jgi:hypothetical protein
MSREIQTVLTALWVSMAVLASLLFVTGILTLSVSWLQKRRRKTSLIEPQDGLALHSQVLQLELYKKRLERKGLTPPS